MRLRCSDRCGESAVLHLLVMLSLAGLLACIPQTQAFSSVAPLRVSTASWPRPVQTRQSSMRQRLEQQQPQQRLIVRLVDASAAISLPEDSKVSSSDDGVTINTDASQDRLFEKPLVGIRRDFSARWPLWRSDFTDGFSVQCVAATMFLFFACLAPAVGFGGLYGVATNGAMGTVEMVASTAVGGIVYALCSAQPMTIIGGT
jgi:HCO3- transporter family